MIRLNDADTATILALNLECEAMLVPLDVRRLHELLHEAYRVTISSDRSAMMIAFDERAPSYDSPNYRWFAARYPRFVYVDRVAVSAGARGRGAGRQLYEQLFAQARADGHTIACAEVYSDPPNDASIAFHKAMGFTEVGSAYLPERGKTVTYFARSI